MSLTQPKSAFFMDLCVAHPTAVTYVCQSCGARTRQFFGRCPKCGSWGSLAACARSKANNRQQRPPSNSLAAPSARRATPIATPSGEQPWRLPTGCGEFDRVLGGGLVTGSLVLVGGNPGIGKSTLLLQSANAMARSSSVLYVSAEESAQQVRLRWQRLAVTETDLQLLAETDLDLVLEEIQTLQPAVTVVDSIQALHSADLDSSPGSIAQVRECTMALRCLARRQGTTLILIGHVTKEGILAGPKVLEHLVDAVLTFEGDRFASYRLLRAVKNRFGATHELGLFKMHGCGLIEVSKPSELFLSEQRSVGVATIVACGGTRSLIVDLQALVSATSYASPRRTATGVSTNRLHQILAVLEKHTRIPLSRHDCYLAVAGGLEVEEPAADLGVAVAIVSSFRNLILPVSTVLIGELGLGGQLRPVSQLELRLQEAARLGFRRAVIPRSPSLETSALGLRILEASSITEALMLAMSNEGTSKIDVDIATTS